MILSKIQVSKLSHKISLISIRNNELSIIGQKDDFLSYPLPYRLSTVKNADRIVVIDQGKIIETGKHQELIVNGGAYYNLVKNQLELGD